jgi:hypothetical protein
MIQFVLEPCGLVPSNPYDSGTVCYWNGPSIVRGHILIYPCILFKYKFNCLNLKISYFLLFEIKKFKKIQISSPIHLYPT